MSNRIVFMDLIELRDSSEPLFITQMKSGKTSKMSLLTFIQKSTESHCLVKHDTISL